VKRDLRRDVLNAVIPEDDEEIVERDHLGAE
jgi:hypothetical protein